MHEIWKETRDPKENTKVWYFHICHLGDKKILHNINNSSVSLFLSLYPSLFLSANHPLKMPMHMQRHTASNGAFWIFFFIDQ